MKPNPFEGTSLIPLNQMDKKSYLYKKYIQKYIGREDLMNGVIPKLDCKWNDVVQFSALNPQIIVDHLRIIDKDFKLTRAEYFRIHVDKIIGNYDAVVFDRVKKQEKRRFMIEESEVFSLDHSYKELTSIPKETMSFWDNVVEKGGKFLWFAFIPHILIKGRVDASEFEVRTLH